MLRANGANVTNDMGYVDVWFNESLTFFFIIEELNLSILTILE